MTPTQRIARDIAGQDPRDAYRELACQCFSPAEAAEIVAGTSTALQGKITDDIDRIEAQIKSTIECSVRIGDRLEDEINW
jgi:hypothetical protein